MADLNEAQRKRAEARKRRRNAAPADEPENTVSEAGGANGDEAHHGVKQAAKVAAAVGAAGAAAAAARVLASHGDGDEQAAEEREPEPRESDGPEAVQEPPEQPPEEAEEAEEPQPAEEPEQEESRREPQPEPVAGAAERDARAVIDRARPQLENLLERPVESVSSLERTHDGWVLALEVVELSRIPESTDVLASYEMELDEDLNLRRYQQVRRYHRGRAELGESV